MSAVLSHQAAPQADVSVRLAFQKQLQAVTNKIHATSNIDEIMLEVSADICALFNADRLTIYSVSEDKQAIVSKVKTGLNSFKDPYELKAGMVFAVETFCPAKDGVSAARIEEEVVLTPRGAKVITLFPAQELPIANKY